MNIQGIFKNKGLQIVVLSIISFAGGYVLGKKNGVTYVVKGTEVQKTNNLMIKQNFLPPKYSPTDEAALDKEEAEHRYNEHHEDHLETPQDRFVSSLKRDDSTIDEVYELKDNEVIEEPQSVTISTNNNDDWDYEFEMSTREKDIPYVLHRDEFFGEEMGYNQETLTYYAGDDIMGDNDDTPIYNYQGLMGELKFGHGSGDSDVVYIRNEKLHLEWEILLNQGMFAQEVLGLELEQEAEDEIRHSYSVLKFRQE